MYMAKKKTTSKGSGGPQTKDVRREVGEDESITVGAGNIDREPLPDDAYLDGCIRGIELRENVPNNFGGDPFDKLAFRVEALDFPDEHSDEGGNRLAFCGAKVSMHPKSNLYKWVKSILGVDPKDGMEFRPLSLLHVPCRFLLKSWENDDGTIGQVITDFKPYTGKLKKGMTDPSDAAEELTGSAGKSGGKKKTSKKTSSKPAAGSDEEWFDEDKAETVAEYLREGGADLVGLISSECGFTKKLIQSSVKGKDDGEATCFNTLFLLATNKHAAKFEGLAKPLEAWGTQAELDADNYTEWGTFAAHACASCGVDEWPKTIKDLNALIKGGPQEPEGEDEEEEDEDEGGEDEDWAVGHRCGVDYDGEVYHGEITAIDDDTATVKFDDDSEEEVNVDDLLEADEDEDGEEGDDEDEDADEDEGDDEEDDDGLGFLDE